jgi:ketosteroid isomerase-like protein
MKMRNMLLVAVVAGCVGCSTGTGADAKAKDQADIKALEDRFTAAFKAKDVNAIMALYAPDANMVVFDAVPPLQYTGWEAYKKDFQAFFAAFPGEADFTMTDLQIETGGRHCIRT